MEQTTPELLGTIVLHQSGSFMQVRRYYRGIHPALGVITWGLTGWETMVETSVIRPIGTFIVAEPCSTPNASSGGSPTTSDTRPD